MDQSATILIKLFDFRISYCLVVPSLLQIRPVDIGRGRRTESRSEAARDIFSHQPGKTIYELIAKFVLHTRRICCGLIVVSLRLCDYFVINRVQPLILPFIYTYAHAFAGNGHADTTVRQNANQLKSRRHIEHGEHGILQQHGNTISLDGNRKYLLINLIFTLDSFANTLYCITRYK